MPTPLHRLPRLSDELGVDLWIKRDDLTGLALGGNKGRKLEYLIAEAVAAEAQVVVTCGAAQSNFVRQLGAACAMVGIRCAAVVMPLPYEPPAGKPEVPPLGRGGNLTLDALLGVELEVLPDGTWDELFEATHALAEKYRSQGLRVYEIPIGGSSPLGAYAFWEAAAEADGQAGAFDAVVVPTSSGSTHAGVAYYHQGTATRVVGIACDPEPELVEELARLAAGVDELTGLGKGMKPADFELKMDWVGPGYGVPSTKGNRAIERLARSEGILLDPVYSGKTFSGLLDLVETRELGGRVLFWHTGGVPTLFCRE